MELFKRTMTLPFRSILHRKHNEKSGQAWISGYFIILLVFSLVMILYFKYKLDITVEETQNNLTTSTLGAMLPDYRELSLNGDIILENTDSVVDRLLDLLAKNSELERDINDVSLDATMTGEHKLYATDVDDVVVTKVIIYNYYESKGKLQTITYENKDGTLEKVSVVTTNVSDATNEVARTPQNEVVTNTSIFVEETFPIRVCGIPHIIRKGELISTENLDVRI